jgi:hypothetical protein
MARSKKTRARARERWVDTITGEPVTPGSAGAVRAGGYVARARPREGEPLETIEVAEGELGKERRTWAVEVDDATIRARAREVAKRRKALEKIGRDVRKRKTERIPGLSATFKGGRIAADLYLGRNADFYSQFSEVDAGDMLREWAGGEMVRAGRSKRLVRFDQTKRGREILKPKRGATSIAMIRDLVRWQFGQASPRRWEAVDWGRLRGFDDADDALREAHARNEGAVGWSSLAPAEPYWYPPLSGLYSGAELMAHPDVRDNPKAQAILSADLNAQAARTARERLEKAYEGARRCIEPDAARAVRRRIRLLRKIEREPEIADDRAFCFREVEAVGFGEDVGAVEAGACDFPTLVEDSRRLADACAVAPYDPAWALGADLRSWEVESLPRAVRAARGTRAPVFVSPEPDIPF